MAYAPGSWKVEYNFVDRDNNDGSCIVYLSAASLFPALVIAASGFAALLAALSDAKLSSYSISVLLVDDAIASSTPPETSDVERKGRFKFRCTNQALLTMNIPSVKNTLVVDGSNIIDAADDDVAAYIDAMVSDNLFTTTPTNRFAVDVDHFEAPAKKIHVGSTEG